MHVTGDPRRDPAGRATDETRGHRGRGTTVHLRDGSWRQVTWADCRLGALLATGARLDGVTVRGGKIHLLARPARPSRAAPGGRVDRGLGLGGAMSGD